ncbi:MAG: hypothetical protein WKF88_05815 [Ferruginibacter sp.]
MVSRTMGGISAGFVDSSGSYPYIVTPGGRLLVSSSSVNLSNPASLGNVYTTLFDVGGEIDVRTIKSNSTPEKYTATNTIFSYLQLAFPITPKRMLAKGNHWTIAFGLRPVTRVNYKIITDKRLLGIDSITTLYEGNGGLSRANLSTGIKIKNFSFGASTGYNFGNRETSTKIAFNNDSVKYMQSNTESRAQYGGVFLNLGAQYGIRLKGNSMLRIGATANLEQTLKAKRDKVNETFIYDADGVIRGIDTVTFSRDESGNIKLPASYTLGFTITNTHWVFGADVNYTSWSDYRYFGAPDAVQNNTTLHVGAQYFPADVNTPTKNKYWNFVKYRAGVYYGNDYVKLKTNRPDFGITLGAGLPLTSFQRLRFGEFVALNTGVEIGQLGNKQNLGIRETKFRFNFGVAMTASWFQKRKYD